MGFLSAAMTYQERLNNKQRAARVGSSRRAEQADLNEENRS